MEKVRHDLRNSEQQHTSVGLHVLISAFFEEASKESTDVRVSDPGFANQAPGSKYLGALAVDASAPRSSKR